MLVLTRKTDEVILIGSEIKVTIVRIGPDVVRIGIDAPEHINIVREEIADALRGDSTGDALRDSAGMGGGLGDEDSGAE